ncbi:MAG: hypothetical protein WA941_06050 [Nitrososphaeraceae archaeon]
MNKLLLAAVIVKGLGVAYYLLYQYNYNEAKDTMSLVMPDYMLVHAQPENLTQGNLTLYENRDYGFSVGYPSSVNWTAREYDLARDQVVVIDGPENVKIGIEVISAPGFLSPGQLKAGMQQAMISDLDYKLMSISSNTTTLSGYSAVEANYYENTLTSRVKVLEVVGIVKPGGIDGITDTYIVRYSTDPAHFDKYLPIVSAMLESFKIGL